MKLSLLLSFILCIYFTLSQQRVCLVQAQVNCDLSQLYDAELLLLYDDTIPFELVPRRVELPLNTTRFPLAKQQEALQFFKTRFNIDFTNSSNVPTNFRLESGSFEGYHVYGATTTKSRFFGSPLIRVYADFMTLVALDSSAIDPFTNAPINKDSLAQYGYYTMLYVNNGTAFTAPIKATSQRFLDAWRDNMGNLDWARTIDFNLESPEWGVGESVGTFLAPMQDPFFGRSQVAMRETMRFPPTRYLNRGQSTQITSCQSWLN
ncbi:hypothetical protein C9374_007299 [Naegleria lovaniensis]|uniref:Uncharacterized protein n=1 Tax=Naegleria lovaniensis TaxID=51637 RepID=A0AA88GZA3_NAELO|nr:uncharacterized protein C9374_007299 [Naegleria lovaniensis]KAG2393768.1 hypothetical protein C9374_007299 [Naegleria lovaniensis]